MVYDNLGAVVCLSLPPAQTLKCSPGLSTFDGAGKSVVAVACPASFLVTLTVGQVGHLGNERLEQEARVDSGAIDQAVHDGLVIGLGHRPITWA